MPQGYLAVVLHTHLPFVRHPEHDRPLEERWLHEALSECYLPLIAAMDRLEADRVPFALTMSLTPPLAAMLRDEMLCNRFDDHLARIERLAQSEVKRLKDDPYFGPVAVFYKHHFAEVRATWERIGGNVVDALVRHHDAGNIDLITCSATHAYLPGLMPTREALRAQLKLGVEAFKHLVGREPLGMWLPECAYDPSFDGEIARTGIRYTLLDTHGLTNASPRPPFGVYHPIVSPSGTAFFARDTESSRQVWSREVGYPGNPYYRDFYRDVGYDLSEDQLLGEVGPFGARIMTGLKYHRITGKMDQKLPYQPGVASERAKIDAANFLAHREAQVRELAATMPVQPIVVSPYDSELFGHWWFEGPQFLEALFRVLQPMAKQNDVIGAITLRKYLERHLSALLATHWLRRAGGFGEVWAGPSAARFWRHIHHSSRYVMHLVSEHRSARGDRGRALDLAIRELLLLQTSDWPFILRTGSVTEYAEARIRAHTGRLRRLGDMVESASLSQADITWMHDLDTRDNFLSTMPSETLRSAFS
ncbi:MAG: 1,4-alpha-glucan branching protein domain-containing protein [Polyangiaceae bacterium]